MEPIKAKKAAVITDRNVAKLYLDKLKQRLKRNIRALPFDIGRGRTKQDA